MDFVYKTDVLHKLFKQTKRNVWFLEASEKLVFPIKIYWARV